MRNAGGLLLVVEAALYTCPLVHFGAALTVLFWYAVTPAGQRPDINKNANIDSRRADLVVTEPPQSRGERRKWRALLHTHTHYKKSRHACERRPEVSAGAGTNPWPNTKVFCRLWLRFLPRFHEHGAISIAASRSYSSYTLLPAITKWTYKYCCSFWSLQKKQILWRLPMIRFQSTPFVLKLVKHALVSYYKNFAC